MSTVGEQLRKAREARKLAVHEVADMTKIRGDHIRALEDGHFDVFSAPVYIRGFVRTYATLLKLDTAQILEQLGRELADSGQVDPMLVKRKRSILDAIMFQLSKFSGRMVWPVAGVAAVALVIVGGYFLWSHYHNADPTAGLGAGLYQMPTNAGETLPLPAPR